MKKSLPALSTFIAVILFVSNVLAQSNTLNTSTAVEESPVQWITFEEAVERAKTEKRKIFIDLYTDWCGWCKVMDQNTFSQEEVARILNEKFYPVKFDAEQLEDVVFDGVTFKFVPSGSKGYHQLAAALLNNKLAYPSQVFLDENFSMIQPIQGYQDAVTFHKIIQFIGEDHFKTMKWDAWQTVYKSPFASVPQPVTAVPAH